MNKKIFSFIIAASLVTINPAVGSAGEILLQDTFGYPNGLLTNEYTYWNPNDPKAAQNPIWELDSGSLFANNGTGWTGLPDSVAPNAQSSNGTNSSIFRLKTKRTDFGDVSVSFSIINQGLTSNAITPAVDWDGFHIWLRYQSETHLYYTSINRRDNTAVIKKKVTGGPSNGGTYYELSKYVPFTVPYNVVQQVRATVKNNPDGSVTLQLFSGDKLVVSAVDNGTIGGAPIRAPGRVGIRGDNANLKFDDFTVTTLDDTPVPNPTPSPSPSPSPIPSKLTPPQNVRAVPGDTQVMTYWNSVSGATSYNLYRSRFPGVTKANGFKIANAGMPYLSKGFVNGTRYYMVVTAVNASGESAESAEVSAIPVANAPPLAPDGIKTVAGDTQVSISWNSVAGAKSYNLYRSRFKGVTKANGYKIANVTSAYLNRGFVNGTTYYMVVTAVNAVGESEDSVEVAAVPFGGGVRSSEFGALAAPNIDSFRVYPNPWKSNQHQSLPITFDQLTDHATVKIFTLSGHWVTTLETNSANITWDLKNNDGERVASGVYLYLISNDKDSDKRGTLTVIQ